MTIAFQSHDRVVADIVLIAWKRVDTLRSCLESLRAMNDGPPFGVRIAANGASDEVVQFLRDEVEGTTVIDLSENIGFGGGCNAAAAGSTAEYLVFLNDDASPAPDWLTELVAAADKDTAVGSILVNSDGSLQEAGARVLSDGYTQVLGSGVDWESARSLGLLTPREVDYASAAALLVPRLRFEELGGFDLEYRPAYWEDVDLCFRFRLAGGRIRLQPSARATHLGFGSVSDDPRLRQFALQHGHAVFTRRWATSLASAATESDPIDKLTTIVPPEGPGVLPRQLVSLDPESVHTIAFSIRADYAKWLNDNLDEADLELARTRAEVARLRDANEAANARLIEQDSRIATLERSAQDEHEQASRLRTRVEELIAQIDSLIDADAAHVLLWWRRARRAQKSHS